MIGLTLAICDQRANEKPMEIFPQTMRESLNESVSDGGDCRTAPATTGLVNTAHIAPPSIT